MPVYEYFCSNCRTKFDALRSMSEADVAIQCQHCESTRTARVLSLFFANSGARTATTGLSESGGCACGGQCACGQN